MKTLRRIFFPRDGNDEHDSKSSAKKQSVCGGDSGRWRELESERELKRVSFVSPTNSFTSSIHRNSHPSNSNRCSNYTVDNQEQLYDSLEVLREKMVGSLSSFEPLAVQRSCNSLSSAHSLIRASLVSQKFFTVIGSPTGLEVKSRSMDLSEVSLSRNVGDAAKALLEELEYEDQIPESTEEPDPASPLGEKCVAKSAPGSAVPHPPDKGTNHPCTSSSVGVSQPRAVFDSSAPDSHFSNMLYDQSNAAHSLQKKSDQSNAPHSLRKNSDQSNVPHSLQKNSDQSKVPPALQKNSDQSNAPLLLRKKSDQSSDSGEIHSIFSSVSSCSTPDSLRSLPETFHPTKSCLSPIFPPPPSKPPGRRSSIDSSDLRCLKEDEEVDFSKDPVIISPARKGSYPFAFAQSNLMPGQSLPFPDDAPTLMTNSGGVLEPHPRQHSGIAAGHVGNRDSVIVAPDTQDKVGELPKHLQAHKHGGSPQSPSQSRPQKDLESKYGQAQGRRIAIYNARGNSVAYGNTVSSERRLPGDGGLPAPRAHRDAHVIAAACDGIALFQGLHPEDRRVLYENMYQLEYGPKENIVKQGEDGRNFYIIVEGSPIVQVKNEKMEIEVERKLATGDTFGEVALLHSCPRSATVMVGPGDKERVKVWALDRNSFTKLLSTAAYSRRERFAQALRNVELLKHLTDYKKLQLADALVPKSYAAGADIIKQDVVEGARFHIIEKGSVSVKVKLGEKTETVNKLGPGQYFGEVTLREEVPPTATITAEVQTDTLTLDRASFKRLLGSDAVQSLMAGHMKNYVYDKSTDSPKTPGGGSGGPNRLYSGETPKESVLKSLTLGASDFFRGSPSRSLDSPKSGKKKKLLLNSCRRNDLQFIKELGLGMSGVAYLCKMPNHGGRYVVVKMMSKAKLIRLNQVENVMREKDILIKFDHHFIIDCLGHFQDACYCYLLMDFMAGGELFSLLNEKQKFSLPLSRFYAAEVLLSLEYIHSLGFVYRDLKPENILIEASGHIRLADMGFCKPLKEGERTYTTCGTADYMAPEVMLSQGHDKAADFWAYGVLIFEMLAGFAPFEGKTDNERLHRILKGLLNFPADFNLHAKDLVSKLCVVDLSNRYGMMAGGLKDIKEHPFFAGLDWFELKNRMIRPPHIPRSVAMSRFEKYQVKMQPPTVADFIGKDDNALFAGY